MTHKTLFISDLHLDNSHPEITREFLTLLNSCDETVDGLYILGDLFEAWIGDDDQTPFHQQIIKALRAATDKGLKIYIMLGNRDFLLGKSFFKETGCRFISDDEFKIDLYGTPVLLMHGDTLCTRDVAYLKARKIAKNTLYQRIFLWLPLWIRKKIAEKMRAKSMKYTQTAPREIMDVTQDEVIKVMERHSVLHLIHGHTHRPATHEFLLNNITAKRIVLGAWHDGPSVQVWEAQSSG